VEAPRKHPGRRRHGGGGEGAQPFAGPVLGHLIMDPTFWPGLRLCVGEPGIPDTQVRSAAVGQLQCHTTCNCDYTNDVLK
jgi:hypothetical protein